MLDIKLNVILLSNLSFICAGVWYFIKDIFTLGDSYHRDTKNIKTYKKIINNVIINTILINTILIYISLDYINIIQHITIWDTIVSIVLYTIMVDILFYTNHRLLHTKYLYKFHKKHHEMVHPIGISSLYMSKFEYISNYIIIFVPMYISPPNILTLYLYVCLININIILSHCGYVYWGRFHYLHHETQKYNYGVFGIMDTIFATKYVK